MKVKVSDLRPNPYRDLKRLPLDPTKVEALVHSIKATSFWDNLLARKVKGEFEIAYGHHRLAALKKAGVKEIDIPVRSLSNTEMAKIMAHENMAEWAQDAATQVETVRAVLQAYAANEIELPAPPKKTNGHAMRYADDRSTSTDHPYTAETLCDFLNWKLSHVKAALDVLGQQDEGLLDAETLGDLTTGQAEAIAQQVRRVAKDPKYKHRAKEIGKSLAAGMRKGAGKGKRDTDAESSAVTVHSAKRVTDELLDKFKAPIKNKAGERIPDVNEFASQMLSAIESSFSGSGTAAVRLNEILEFRDYVRPAIKDRLIKALRAEARACEIAATTLIDSKSVVNSPATLSSALLSAEAPHG